MKWVPSACRSVAMTLPPPGRYSEELITLRASTARSRRERRQSRNHSATVLGDPVRAVSIPRRLFSSHVKRPQDEPPGAVSFW